MNIKTSLDLGENVAVEFKRCGKGIEPDTYESVCSFLNRFGGDIFMGVEDISNPTLFSPTIYLVPEIVDYDGLTIIHVHVPASAEVHSYKRTIYDRVNHAGGNHPWADMNDTQLLQSAGLYGMDMATGEKGYNLAAVMLLGKDDVILNICPTYETDALVRKINIGKCKPGDKDRGNNAG